MEKEIIDVLTYFSQFQYPPTLTELNIFLANKSEHKDVLKTLSKLIHKNKISTLNNRYTLPQYGISQENVEGRGKNFFETQAIRNIFAERKKRIAENYIWWLSKLPQIRLIGLSGSLAMSNTEAFADIDLFIITSARRIWTTRLFSLLLAQIAGRRRKRNVRAASDKICLNLFFTEDAMRVPREKRTSYVAHEILQMKPLFFRGNTYVNFLLQNDWVNIKFPNARQYFTLKNKKNKKKSTDNNKALFWSLRGVALLQYLLNKFGDFVENCCRWLQLRSINKHRTTELVSDDQLWFFPDDYEKKLRT